MKKNYKLSSVSTTLQRGGHRLFKSCRYLVALVIPVLLTLLAGCTSADLQTDPRTSKYAALLKGDYQTAVKQLNQDIEANPNNLDALYWRATIEVEKGNVEDGIRRLDDLLQKFPAYSFGYSERSRANFNALHFEKAIADANLAIHYRPDVARNYVRRAAAYLILHQPDKALDDLAAAVKLAPQEDVTYVKLLTGYGQFQLKNYKQAAADFSAVIDRDPKNTRAYVHRALCYVQLKDLKDAQADSDKACKVNPGDLSAKILHSALLSAAGHREEARRQLIPSLRAKVDERAIADTADFGSDVPSIADAVLACVAAGHPQSGIAVLDLVQAHRPLDPQENFAFAKAALAKNDRFRAAKALNECLAMQPTWIEPRLDLIKLYLADNLAQKAREVQKEGLTLPLSGKDKKELASALR